MKKKKLKKSIFIDVKLSNSFSSGKKQIRRIQFFFWNIFRHKISHSISQKLAVIYLFIDPIQMKQNRQRFNGSIYLSPSSVICSLLYKAFSCKNAKKQSIQITPNFNPISFRLLPFLSFHCTTITNKISILIKSLNFLHPREITFPSQKFRYLHWLISAKL